jgi:threonine/homoserine/homoserine lactone efflux protein
VSGALFGFALASTLLIVAPGPDTMLVMRNTIRGGRTAGWVTACGTMSGLAIWAVVAALGLAALLRVSHIGYDVLRFAGGAYLIWLGATSLGLVRRRGTGHSAGPAEPSQGPAQAPSQAPSQEAAQGAAAQGAAMRVRAYLTGVLSNLLNPKIGVFFVAFLPAFIPAGVSPARFSLVLGLWFMVETGLWLGVVAWLADRGVRWLRRPVAKRWLDRSTGIVLIGFGIRLVTSSR